MSKGQKVTIKLILKAAYGTSCANCRRRIISLLDSEHRKRFRWGL